MIAAATGVGASLGALAGCAPSPPPAPATLRLADTALATGQRLRVTVGTTPVELQRTVEGVLARSLVCTHQGCTVAWQEEHQRYLCPCQDAWFDKDGQPVAGPISKPLPLVPVVVANGIIEVTLPGPDAASH